MSNGHLAWLIRHQRRREGGPDGGHIKARETLVGLSRDAGLARQDTFVAFVRQPCPVSISSFFLSHIYLYSYTYLVFSVCASCGSTCSCRLNGARSESSRPRRWLARFSGNKRIRNTSPWFLILRVSRDTPEDEEQEEEVDGEPAKQKDRPTDRSRGERRAKRR